MSAAASVSIEGLAAEIEKRLRRSRLAIPVGVSNRHCHLTQEHFKILFGNQAEPKRVKDIKQPGFWAAEESVGLRGPKGVLEKVRLVGPYRSRTQIEISLTDAIFLGIDAPVRESGDVKGSAGGVLIGPAGQIEIGEGVIVARRHIHFNPQEAGTLGVSSGEVVRARAGAGRGRSTVFEDVVVRVSDQYSLEFHVDTDEANAAGIATGDTAYIA